MSGWKSEVEAVRAAAAEREPFDPYAGVDAAPRLSDAEQAQVAAELRRLEDAESRYPGGMSARVLAATDFPEPSWTVPGLIPEGATLLGGRPKIGKSWLLLDLCLGVAAGGHVLGTIPVEAGDVAYLALEDTARRLQWRQRQILGDAHPPGGLTYWSQWPRLHQGGLEQLVAWVEDARSPRLIAVDTLAKVRAPATGRQSVYEADYAAMSVLHDLAGRYGVAVIIAHHLRKEKADDWIDEISGSAGLTGAADTVAGLFRERGTHDATLRVAGRDLDEHDVALRFDATRCQWTVLGDADRYRLSRERREVLDLLEAIGEPLGPKEVAARLGIPEGTAKRRLWVMSNAGQLRSDGGRYSLP